MLRPLPCAGADGAGLCFRHFGRRIFSCVWGLTPTRFSGGGATHFRLDACRFRMQPFLRQRRCRISSRMHAACAYSRFCASGDARFPAGCLPSVGRSDMQPVSRQVVCHIFGCVRGAGEKPAMCTARIAHIAGNMAKSGVKPAKCAIFNMHAAGFLPAPRTQPIPRHSGCRVFGYVRAAPARGRFPAARAVAFSATCTPLPHAADSPPLELFRFRQRARRSHA